jgi:hypothetical protein
MLFYVIENCKILLRGDIMIIRRKKILFITTFLIVTAIAVVLCVGYFTEDKKTEYDGTLVEIRTEQKG